MGIFKIWNKNIFKQIFKAVVKKYKNLIFIAGKKKTKIIEMHGKLLA